MPKLLKLGGVVSAFISIHGLICLLSNFRQIIVPWSVYPIAKIKRVARRRPSLFPAQVNRSLWHNFSSTLDQFSFIYVFFFQAIIFLNNCLFWTFTDILLLYRCSPPLIRPDEHQHLNPNEQESSSNCYSLPRKNRYGVLCKDYLCICLAFSCFTSDVHSPGLSLLTFPISFLCYCSYPFQQTTYWYVI